MSLQNSFDSLIRATDDRILRLFLLLFFFLPGLTHIYIFEFQLFFSLDIIKIMLLSLVFSLPFMMVSILNIYILTRNVLEEMKKNNIPLPPDYQSITQWSSATVVNYYASLLTFFVVGYFITNYNNFWLHMIMVNIIIVLFAVWNGRERKRKR